MNDIDTRLAALEARLPVEAGPPELGAATGRRRRRGVALLAAPILVLALAATAVAGPTIAGLVLGAPGIENFGQPLYGANLECMTPPQAAAYLAARGYTDVVWQIETTAKDPSGAASPVPPALVSTPPAHGFVIPGSMIQGRVHMVIDQRPGATGVGACHAMPMP